MNDRIDTIERKIEVLEHQVKFLYKELEKYQLEISDILRRINTLEKDYINISLESYSK